MIIFVAPLADLNAFKDCVLRPKMPQLRHLECCMLDQQLQQTLNMPDLISARLEVDCWLEDGVKVSVDANNSLRSLELAVMPREGSVANLQLSVFQPLLSYCVHYQD